MRRKGPGIRGTFGDQLLADLESVFRNPYMSLSDLARKYKVSRERMRQLFVQTYGMSMSECKRIRDGLKCDLACSRDPRSKSAEYVSDSNVGMGADAEAWVFRKLESFGYITIPPETTKYDLMANGLRVEVKSATMARRMADAALQRYYHFAKIRPGFYDILVCCILPKGFVDPTLTFVIPYTVLGERKQLFICDSSERRQYGSADWWDYVDAWHWFDILGGGRLGA